MKAALPKAMLDYIKKFQPNIPIQFEEFNEQIYMWTTNSIGEDYDLTKSININ